MTNPIKAARNGAILELTIDRPKANAFDAATSRALGEALVAYQEDDNLRCAIITGAGDKFFSGGWDLKAAAELGNDESKMDYGPGGFAGITELWSLTKPVIAAIEAAIKATVASRAFTEGCERLGARPAFAAAPEFAQVIARADGELATLMAAVDLKQQ